MNLFDLLRSDGSIVVNKALAHTIGLNEAIIYSELVSLNEYWKSKEQLTDGEWFYCTIENLQKNTTLKRSTQDKAIKNLEKLGLIHTRRMGLPAKRYFRITDKIYELILSKAHSNQFVENKQTRVLKNEHTSLRDLNKQDSRNQTTNNTRTNNTEFNNTEYLYLYHEDKLNVLWEINIPKALKTKLKDKISNLSVNQIHEIEQAYHHHLMTGNVVEDETAYNDPEVLNTQQFTDVIVKMLDNVDDIKNIKGLIKKWVLKAISFKMDNILGFDYSSGKKYDWLNNQ
ncbi:hypothetical protein [Halobacillus ihumii]|uniref:hypothetical protein n=1 Tax=Halobacillus ihumii TaxID=2686092 RepID=UPI0013D87C3B|nr:hypothetical protein [Halobacillus ihumii]